MSTLVMVGFVGRIIAVTARAPREGLRRRRDFLMAAGLLRLTGPNTGTALQLAASRSSDVRTCPDALGLAGSTSARVRVTTSDPGQPSAFHVAPQVAWATVDETAAGTDGEPVAPRCASEGDG